MNNVSLEATLQPIDAAEFERSVLRSRIPVLVDFTTRWCGPCKALAPLLSAVATAHAGRIAVITVDGDRCPELAARYRVRGYPTVIAFAGGVERDRQLGLCSRARLDDMVGALAS